MKNMHKTQTNVNGKNVEDEEKQNDKNDKYKWNKHFHM